MNMSESKYVENRAYAARCANGGTPVLRGSARSIETEFGSEEEWLRHVRESFPKFIPFLSKNCGLEFSGRILEIGAGGAWFTGEISKLPRVVEITAIDASPEKLKELAPKVFKMTKANTAKITRMPGDYHLLDFPKNHFDFVLSSAVLHHARNIVQVLREAKRVLKPGGRLVAIREPVWPLVKIKSRSKMLAKLLETGVNEHFYTLSDYKEFFKQAALPLEVKRVNLSSGFRYYVNAMVNGLTHARYAFVGTKRNKS